MAGRAGQFLGFTYPGEVGSGKWGVGPPTLKLRRLKEGGSLPGRGTRTGCEQRIANTETPNTPYFS